MKNKWIMKIKNLLMKKTWNRKFLKLLRNLNVSEGEIKRLQLDAIRQKELSEGPYQIKRNKQNFVLPKLFQTNEIYSNIYITNEPFRKNLPIKKYI